MHLTIYGRNGFVASQRAEVFSTYNKSVQSKDQLATTETPLKSMWCLIVTKDHQECRDERVHHLGISDAHFVSAMAEDHRKRRVLPCQILEVMKDDGRRID